MTVQLEGQTTLPLLTLASSRTDLPLSWDGVPVDWSEWKTGRTTLPLHLPAEDFACSKCGSVDESIHAFGTRPPESGATVTTTRTKKTSSGREYSVNHEIPAWPVKDLIASRCRDCGHDVVTDERTGLCWDLDESDYGKHGSTEGAV